MIFPAQHEAVARVGRTKQGGMEWKTINHKMHFRIDNNNTKTINVSLKNKNMEHSVSFCFVSFGAAVVQFKRSRELE